MWKKYSTHTWLYNIGFWLVIFTSRTGFPFFMLKKLEMSRCNAEIKLQSLKKMFIQFIFIQTMNILHKYMYNASFHSKTFFAKPVYYCLQLTNHPTSDISYLNHCPQWSKHETWIIFPSWFYSCLIDPWQTCSTASAEWIRNCWRYSSTSKYIPTHLLLFRVCNQDTD